MAKMRAWCRECGMGGIVRTGWTRVDAADAAYCEERGIRVIHPRENGPSGHLARLRLRHLPCPSCGGAAGCLSAGRGPAPLVQLTPRE